jgi:LCP family protein required for cell wall assembly
LRKSAPKHLAPPGATGASAGQSEAAPPSEPAAAPPGEAPEPAAAPPPAAPESAATPPAVAQPVVGPESAPALIPAAADPASGQESAGETSPPAASAHPTVVPTVLETAEPTAVPARNAPETVAPPIPSASDPIGAAHSAADSLETADVPLPPDATKPSTIPAPAPPGVDEAADPEPASAVAHAPQPDEPAGPAATIPPPPAGPVDPGDGVQPPPGAVPRAEVDEPPADDGAPADLAEPPAGVPVSLAESPADLAEPPASVPVSVADGPADAPEPSADLLEPAEDPPVSAEVSPPVDGAAPGLLVGAAVPLAAGLVESAGPPVPGTVEPADGSAEVATGPAEPAAGAESAGEAEPAAGEAESSAGPDEPADAAPPPSGPVPPFVIPPPPAGPLQPSGPEPSSADGAAAPAGAVPSPAAAAVRAGPEPTAPKARVRLKRRWPRRTLIGANVIVLLALAAAASAYGYVRYQINSIRTAPFHVATPEGCQVGECSHSATTPSYAGLKPENILLIGNETRQGLTVQEQLSYGSAIGHSGSLADIMMILHLDPANATASILSIPRDLFSPMPTTGQVGPYQKLDAALNDGAEGPNNLASAVQQDLGIPINHFIELNFNGFINSVNALGGINVYFPDPVFDAESLLYIPNPGCHHLNGIGALALVRARHLQYEPPGQNGPDYTWPQEPESDLARIVRTHTFLKIVAQTAKAKGLTNPLTANNFISAVIGQMTVDPGLKSEMLNLILRYRHIDAATIPETTLPTTPVNNYYYDGYGIGDVLFPVQPADINVIKAWDSNALPAPVSPAAVSVVSINGSYEAALSAGHALASDGLKVTSETSGTVPSDTTETLVLYHPGDTAQALDVMKYLSGAVMMQVSPTTAAGKVEVDLGSSVAVKAAPATPKTTTTSSITATTSAHSVTSATTGASATTRATTPSSHTTHTTHAAVTTSTVPTPEGYTPSASADQQEPWDPRAC